MATSGTIYGITYNQNTQFIVATTSQTGRTNSAGATPYAVAIGSNTNYPKVSFRYYFEGTPYPVAITLYPSATWQDDVDGFYPLSIMPKAKAKVTFKSNGGGHADQTVTYTYGTSGQRLGNSTTDGWTRSGYTFLGWAWNASATTQAYTKNNSVADSWIQSANGSRATGQETVNLTLYAVWADVSAPTLNLNITSITDKSCVISASSNVNCDRWDYSFNGTNWTNFSTTNGKSASKTLTGLTPNTSYTIYVRGRKQSNQVYGSKNKTITTVGASTPTATNVNVGESTAISWTPYNAAYTFDLSVNYGTWHEEINGISPGSTAKVTRNILVPESLATQISGTTATINVVLKTFSNGTQIGGDVSTTFTATVVTPSEDMPTIQSITVEEGAVSPISPSSPIFIQDVSALAITIVTTKGQYSSYQYKRVTVGGVTYNAQDQYNTSDTAVITTNVIRDYGSIDIFVEVADNRGNVATRTVTVNVLERKQPTVNVTVDANGSALVTKVDFSIMSVMDNGTELNRATIRVRRALASNMSSWTTNTATRTTASGTYNWTQSSGIDETETYAYYATVTDLFGNTITSPTVYTAITAMSFLQGGRGVRFFGEASNDGLWVENVDYTISDSDAQAISTLLAAGSTELRTILMALSSHACIEEGKVTAGGTSWTYKKFADKTCVLYGTATVSSLSMSAVGSIYMSGAVTISFPSWFSVNHWTGICSGAGCFPTAYGTVSGSSIQCRINSAVSTITSTGIKLTAWGTYE